MAERAPSLPAPGPAPRRLVGVQMLRAVAAIMVLVHHVFEESHSLFAADTFPTRAVLAGAWSVDLFFAISGFIMLHSSWRQVGRPGAVPTFVSRRFVRIFPLYWVCVLAFFVAKGAGLYKSVGLQPYPVVASILLLPSHRLLISTAWTLVFEMYFYVLFALWLRARSPRHVVIGLPLTSLIITLGSLALPASDLRDYLTNPITFDFLFGMFVAALYRAGHSVKSPLLVMLAAGSLVVITSIWHPATAAHVTDGLDRSVRFLFWGVPAALVVFASLSLRDSRTLLRRWLVEMGDASYSLYLTHGFVMTAYARLIKTGSVIEWMPTPAWMTLVTCFALALGWLTHRLVEKPLTTYLTPRLLGAVHS